MKSTTIILILAALVLLVPQTLACVFGLLSTLTIEGIVAPNLQPLPMLAWLYSLLCVWWLLLRFHRITIRRIPWPIWVGVFVGALGVVLFARDYPSLAPARLALSFYVFGGGPLLVVLAILVALMRREQRARDAR